MKKTLLVLLCMISAIALNAQTNKSTNYVYGVDYTHTKVFAANESIDDFAKAFHGINMLLVTEPEKYDFSRIIANSIMESLGVTEPEKYDFSKMLNERVNVIIEPMLKMTSECLYEDMLTWNNLYDQPNCAEIVKNYELPQTEGTGVVLIAKFLDKSLDYALYDFITFDIATREILTQKEVKGKTGGFGLRNYWARTVYNVINPTNFINKIRID